MVFIWILIGVETLSSFSKNKIKCEYPVIKKREIISFYHIKQYGVKEIYAVDNKWRAFLNDCLLF